MMKSIGKKLRSLVLLGAMLIAGAVALSGCELFGDRTPTPQKEKFVDFNVMSFNIRVKTADDKGVKNWSYRCDRVAEYLKENEADVICLQEVTKATAADLTTGLEGAYNVVFYSREEGANAEGLAICYTDDFSLEEESRFWLSETPEEMSKGWGANYYRICVNLLLKHKETGVCLDVYNVHLDHQVEAARVNGLKLIMEKATQKGHPTVVAGDFNTTKDSECFAEISKTMQSCQDKAYNTDDGVTYHNWGAAEETLGQTTAIDFCFVSQDVSPLEFDILQDTIDKNVYYSDHYAISSIIEISYLPLEQA